MEDVIIIDDERYFARQYSQVLDEWYKVTICRSAQEGIQCLKSNARVRALVLDIQMPTPQNVEEYETRSGVDTGIWLLRTCRSELMERFIPILVLTNRPEKEVEARVRPLAYPIGQIEIFHKPNVSPQDFARQVNSAIQRWSKYSQA